jgi:hypothetical protein
MKLMPTTLAQLQQNPRWRAQDMAGFLGETHPAYPNDPEITAIIETAICELRALARRRGRKEMHFRAGVAR